MKKNIEKLGITLAIGMILGLLSGPATAAFNSGSTGADGAFNPAANTQLQSPPSGIFNFTSVNIPAGVTVTFAKNATNTPVTMLVSGDFTLAGTIDISGTSSVPTTNTAEDGGQPGTGGPGGYSGGRGGLISGAVTRRGGAGLGPGGTRGAELCAGGSGGAGGAGYGAVGGNGLQVSGGTNCLEAGGAAYGSNFLLPLIGGSGGGGGSGGTSLGGGGGGGGGGAILIAVSGTVDIQTSGRIFANGGNSTSVIGVGTNISSQWGGCGGAGSGGAIRIVATVVKGSGQLRAVGGVSGSPCGSGVFGNGTGGSGSAGRIRIEAEKLPYGNSGNSPLPSLDFVTGPVFILSQPTLRIANVAGIAAPAAPTGNRDIDLPATTTGPVTVDFASAGIPLGTTVTLTAKPSLGVIVTATSSPLAGTVENATANASITLPTGHSVLTATVSYTITAALGDALMQYAQGERVERIEVVAGMNGPSQATLITVSGKRYPMPEKLPAMPAG